MNPNSDKLIDILKSEGLSDEQVGQYLENIAKLHSEQLYLAIVEMMDESDMQKLESVADDNERMNQLYALFEQKTGKDLQELSDEIMNSLINGMVEDYQKAKIAEEQPSLAV